VLPLGILLERTVWWSLLELKNVLTAML
jgi:hypothetical protein